MDWEGAKKYCSTLGLAGGGWHLPTIGELRTLIEGCTDTGTGGSCSIVEGKCLVWACNTGSCSGCTIFKGPAGGCYWSGEMQGPCAWYWSSSPAEGTQPGAWYVEFQTAMVDDDGVIMDGRVRCAR